MQSLNHELEIEFNNIDKFILEKYKVNIRKKEQLINYVKTSLIFLQSLKVWDNNLEKNIIWLVVLITILRK